VFVRQKRNKGFDRAMRTEQLDSGIPLKHAGFETRSAVARPISALHAAGVFDLIVDRRHRQPIREAYFD
jgi:hypothetical protein